MKKYIQKAANMTNLNSKIVSRKTPTIVNEIIWCAWMYFLYHSRCAIHFFGEENLLDFPVFWFGVFLLTLWYNHFFGCRMSKFASSGWVGRILNEGYIERCISKMYHCNIFGNLKNYHRKIWSIFYQLFLIADFLISQIWVENFNDKSNW
jgi:hypothetical protein